MINFVFRTSEPLSDAYKKKISRSLRKSKNFPFADKPGETITVVVGDWTLYHDKDPVHYILSRESVKKILGVKRLKVWTR